MTTSNDQMTAVEFDTAFDKGDVIAHLDLRSAKPRYPAQRISIDFPKTMIEKLDNEAAKIGVTRTALIKIWVAQQLTNPSGHHLSP